MSNQIDNEARCGCGTRGCALSLLYGEISDLTVRKKAGLLLETEEADLSEFLAWEQKLGISSFDEQISHSRS